MSSNAYLIAYDVGTTGVKTCLFRVSHKLELLESVYEGYPLVILESGGAEQDPEDWWRAVCATTRELFQRSGVPRKEIGAVSFCSQMQCLVLVDQQGKPVRGAMSYMDSRAWAQHAAGIAHGLKISGLNAVKTLTSLRITKAVAASVKDPLWKYHWVRDNEPEEFKKVHKWLDAKEYLICRFTGEFVMTRGSAYGTLLYDSRVGKGQWSKTLCDMFRVDREHLPQLVDSTQVVGSVTPAAAVECGLAAGTPVYGGGGDAELIGVGVGAVKTGETHIYIGTSGWVSTVTDKQIVDISTMVAAIVGVQPDRYHYFAEMETAGKCMEWVKDHLALDEIGIYLEKRNITESQEGAYRSLYDYLCQVVEQVPAGSGGVVFAPWLHGNRCPFEDAGARGIFFNISLETGKSELIRAVIEGIAFHLRWMLEAQEKKLPIGDTVMAAGGGAISPVICQILADILGRRVQTVPSPQNAGAYGAAILMAASLGVIPSIQEAKSVLPEYRTFVPDLSNKHLYDNNYGVFQSLYRDNRKSFGVLNNRAQ